MPARKHEIIWTERYQVSSMCVVGVNSYQGRQPYMEDRFSVITNINESEISLYSIFDGHAGEFAADYACEIIMPNISERITDILELIKVNTQKVPAVIEDKTRDDRENMAQSDEEAAPEIEINLLDAYITTDNLINYEKLLHDEILAYDKILIDRMSKANLFGGTTANIVLVDLTNKLIICANVGDSRAVMCDANGNAFPLSHDHKPNDPEEIIRIRDNGGYISNKNGCWRVDGSLACSRSLGDYPLKQKKVIIADPQITTFKFKDIKNIPKFIIIGSDGLFDVFKNQEACDYIKPKLKEHHYGSRSLMKKAYARRSADNISVIVIKFIKPKPKKAPKPSYDLTSNTYEWLK